MKQWISIAKKYYVFLFALIISILSVNGWSLWLDESSTAFLANSQDFHNFINTLMNWTGSESQMPGFVLSEFVWVKLFGDSEYALRSINIVFVVLLLLYLVSLFNRKTIEVRDKSIIKIYVVLSFLSPFIIYNMNEARVNIALYVFGSLCLSSLLAYCKYGYLKDWILCLICLVIGSSFNLLFFVIVIPMLIIATSYNKRFILDHCKSIGLCVVFLALIGIYYLYTLINGSGGQKEKPGIINIAYTIYEFTGYGGVCLPKNELRTGGDIFGSFKPYILPSALLSISYICIIFSYIKAKCNTRPLVLLIVSLVSFFIISFIGNFRFWSRHLLMIYPIYIYFVAYAIYEIWENKKNMRWTVIFYISILLFGSIRIMTLDCYKKENVKYAIEYCNRYNQNNNNTIYYFGFPKLADYYHLSNYVDCCSKNDNITKESSGLMLFHNSMIVYYTNGQYKGLNPLMDKEIFSTEIIWEDKDSKLLKFYPKSFSAN